MVDKVSLSAQSRTELKKKAGALRKQGLVPAVMYGHGEDPVTVSVDAREVAKVYQKAGTSKLVGIKLDEGRATNVLIHDVQLHPVTGDLMHLDFYTVKMDEEITAEVPLHFVGESTAVYQDEGTLIKSLDAVEIRALPGDLPESIEVDISVLDDFEKTIHVSDLKVPAGVTFLVEPEELVAKVDAPRSDEEMEELEGEVGEAIREDDKEDDVVVSEENEGRADRESKGQ